MVSGLGVIRNPFGLTGAMVAKRKTQCGWLKPKALFITSSDAAAGVI